MQKIKCKCGCDNFIYPFDKKGRPKKYKLGHNRRGIPSNIKLDSISINTGRYRAKLLIKREKCELLFTNQCKGRLEIHHKDKNPLNNNLDNLSVLCCSHHKSIEKELISYENPFYNFYYEDRSGKRRYSK